MKKLPLLAFPSVLHPMLMSFATDTTPASSWIQFARTGSFVSNRYGRFGITRADLSQMKWNFDNVTPAAPTELPIDLDHLSMDPKKPLDGMAVGWVKELELRAEGDELWGKVSWTPTGAELIRSGSYQFFSPSFAKDHVHKNGKRIGTTLLSGALTNHPFLESMSAVTLYNKDVVGQLALSADFFPHLSELPLETDMHRPLALSASDNSTVGSVVTFGVNSEDLVPELSPEERAGTYRIVKVKGQGDDSFVALVSVDGDTPYGWFPAAALAPAAAPADTPSPLPDATVETAANTALAVPPEGAPQGGLDPRVQNPVNFNDGQPVRLSADEANERIHQAAMQLQRDRPGLSYAMAVKESARMNAAYVSMRNEMDEEPEPEPISLSAAMREATSFIDIVHQVQSEQKLTHLRDAIQAASALRPDLARAYREDGV